MKIRHSLHLLLALLSLLLVDVSSEEELFDDIDEDIDFDDINEEDIEYFENYHLGDHEKAASQLHLNEQSWAIAATTSLEPPMNNPFVRNMGKLPPYVHWGCFRPETKASHHHHQSSGDKLQCCKHIFEQMQIEPEDLCWRKTNCDKRSDFLHFCTTNLVAIPPAPATEGRDDDKSLVFRPQFSLYIAPEAVKLYNFVDWRQYLWVTGQTRGHWHYQFIKSPLDLVMDPFTLPKNKDESATSSNEGGTLPKTVPAGLETKVQAGERDNERVFSHRLSLDLTNLQDGEPFNALIYVLFIMPEDLYVLSREKYQACSTLCGACQVEFLDYDEKVSLKKNQLELVQAVVTVEGDKKAETCLLGWRTLLRMEDEDEDLIVGAPFIQYGQVSGLQLELKNYPKPLSTNLQVNDEL